MPTPGRGPFDDLAGRPAPPARRRLGPEIEQFLFTPPPAELLPPALPWRVVRIDGLPTSPAETAPTLSQPAADPGDAPALGFMSRSAPVEAVRVPLDAPPGEVPRRADVPNGAAGWFPTAIDPRAVLAHFPQLSLTQGYVLRAFVWRSGRPEARWLVIAAPANLTEEWIAAALPPGDRLPMTDRVDLGTAWRSLAGFSVWRRAFQTLAAPLDFMSAVQSDGSPAARVAATLFFRVLEDHLACVSLPPLPLPAPWRDRAVLDDGAAEPPFTLGQLAPHASAPELLVVPTISTPRALADFARHGVHWRWEAEVPRWDPTWSVVDGQERVTWYGLERGIARPGRRQIMRVEDTFQGPGAAFKTEITLVALHTPGVFRRSGVDDHGYTVVVD